MILLQLQVLTCRKVETMGTVREGGQATKKNLISKHSFLSS